MRNSGQLDYHIDSMGALCSLSTDSRINHKRLDEEDFVNKYDHNPGIAEEYGCGDMREDVKEPTKR